MIISEPIFEETWSERQQDTSVGDCTCENTTTSSRPYCRSLVHYKKSYDDNKLNRKERRKLKSKKKKKCQPEKKKLQHHN